MDRFGVVRQGQSLSRDRSQELLENRSAEYGIIIALLGGGAVLNRHGCGDREREISRLDGSQGAIPRQNDIGLAVDLLLRLLRLTPYMLLSMPKRDLP
jgi:hypothetical protein